jgi:opacity protein-like surface antigen
MKKILLIILGLALTYGVNAQVRFGVKLGGTLSYLSFKYDGESERSDPKIGFLAGGVLEYSFSSSFALQPELLYVNNGGKYENFYTDGYSLVPVPTTAIFHNLQLPINLKYKIGSDNLKFYATAGPYFGYILSAKEKFKDDSGSVTVDLEGIKKFDFGIGAGLGIEISNKYTVGVGYKYGLANLNDGGEGAKIKIGTFGLSIGYLF